MQVLYVFPIHQYIHGRLFLLTVYFLIIIILNITTIGNHILLN